MKSFYGILLSLIFISILPLLIYAASNEESTAHGTNEGDGVPAHCHPTTVSSSVKIASLRVEEVKIPLIFSLFIIIVILAKIGWHHPWMHIISSSIPESCMLIVVGTHIGGILIAGYRLDECNEGTVLPFRFTPQLFFIFLLPPIIFSAGYFLDNRAFFENIVSILIYAVIGTLWNAFALGLTLWGLSAANLMDSNFTLASALLFGTICSAVDPVAVLAVFDEIHVNRLLHILVFGESLLNDAVTIVLFQVLGAFANIPFDSERPDNANVGVDVVLGILQFFVVVIASIIIGIIFGAITCILTRFTYHVHVLEPVFLFVMGYLSYLFADLFAFSGIVSLITSAIMIKHYVPPNISWKSNITFKYFLKMINVVAEMIIFLYLGLALFDVEVHKWDTGLVLWTILFAFVFRPIGAVALTLLVNLFRFHKIGIKDTFIISYSGLRGAVAFSLALTRLFEEGIDSVDVTSEERELRKSMLTAVTTLLLVTVFVQGTTIKPLVKLIGVKVETVHKVTMNEVIHTTSIDHINSGMQEIAGQFGFNRIWELLHDIDVKYLRKIFERFPEAKDRDIVNKFNTLQVKESRDQCYYRTEKDTQEHGGDSGDNKETSVCDSTLEDGVPVLDELFRANRIHPHEDHYSHVMSRDERDAADHHLQKVKVHHKIKSRTVKGKTSRKLFRRHTTASIPVEGIWGDEERGGVKLSRIESLDREPKGGGQREIEDKDNVDGGGGEEGGSLPLVSSTTVLVETHI